MKRFLQLYMKLDESTGTLDKVHALKSYFKEAPVEDAAWALYFLTGGKVKRAVTTTLLKEWCMEEAKIPQWLFEESYSHVGDLAETISLLIPVAAKDRISQTEDIPLQKWVEVNLASLKSLTPEEQKAKVCHWWSVLNPASIFLLTKMMTGSFRVGVSRGLIERAIAEVCDLPRSQISHRLMGDWKPTAASFQKLISHAYQPGEDDSQPYPFFLASPLEAESLEEIEQKLGPVDDWIVEWKWDGIRAQLVRKGGKTFLWSRGEELITDRFPDISAIGESLPDGTILDGEILAYSNNSPRSFNDLQKRIGRLKVTQTFIHQFPVAFMAYDLLEYEKIDLRQTPLSERRTILKKIIDPLFDLLPTLKISSEVEAPHWEAMATLREDSRSKKVEGFILKRKSSSYQSGRKRGDWWKWKVSPHTIDAVLIYAQPGHGRRSGLYTDYTFALWNDQSLVPVAKAYSGLTDKEITELDRWIRSHTLQKFGPVRSVEALLVFELAFEGVALSTRHKSGVAVRFPRILRWRKDKPLEEANQLQDLKDLIHATPQEVEDDTVTNLKIDSE